MAAPSNIRLSLSVNGRQLREVFQSADQQERDSFLGQRLFIMNFWRWPLNGMTRHFSSVAEHHPDVDAFNRQIELVLDQEAGKVVGAALSVDLWMTLGLFIYLVKHAEDHFEKRDVCAEADLADFKSIIPSFYFPSRGLIIENGQEVGTRETEETTFLENRAGLNGNQIVLKQDLAHDDPAERYNAACFNRWLKEILAIPVAGLLPAPSQN